MFSPRNPLVKPSTTRVVVFLSNFITTGLAEAALSVATRQRRIAYLFIILYYYYITNLEIALRII